MTDTAVVITVGDQVLQGLILDNPVGRQVLATLPMTRTFRDFNAVEKICSVGADIATDGMPRGSSAKPGDIGYYAPSDHLVLYYGHVGYWDGIMIIGRLLVPPSVVEQLVATFQADVEKQHAASERDRSSGGHR
jgi:hypothetical protein